MSSSSDMDATESRSLLGMTAFMDAMLAGTSGDNAFPDLPSCMQRDNGDLGAGPSRGSECVPSLEELHHLRAEEVEALRAIHGDDFSLSPDGQIITVRIRPRAEAWDDEPTADRHLKHQARSSPGKERDHGKGRRRGEHPLEGRVSIHLVMAYTEHYPYSTPIIEVDNRGALSASNEDTLYDALLKEASRLVGPEPMMFNLVLMATEFFTAVRSSHATSHGEMGPRHVPPEDEENGGEESGSEMEEEMTWDPEAGSWTYTWDTARPSRYVGTARDIVAQLQECFNVVNVENILRADLARAFERTRTHFRDFFKPKRMVEAYTPRRMFHGTCATNLPNIVHRGLLIPGTAPGVMVSHGSTFGNGIYLSPDPEYSVPYSVPGSGGGQHKSGRLLVCAALLGAPNGGRLGCVVSQCEKEWVFFNASQVLPCYIVHFHLETVAKMHYLMVSRGGSLVRVQAEAQSCDIMASLVKSTPKHTPQKALLISAERRAQMKRAEYFFGKRVKVEDCNSASDDEEEGTGALYQSAKDAYMHEDGDTLKHAMFQAQRFVGD